MPPLTNSRAKPKPVSQQPASRVIVTEVTIESVNAQITERSQYLREQEAIITGIINDGNNYLLSLNYEIAIAKKELKDTKAKLYDLARERYTAEEDLKSLRNDIREELKNAGLSPSFGV